MTNLANRILQSGTVNRLRNHFAHKFLKKIWRITHRTEVNIAKIEKARVLVVAPHMDDETFACGGLLLLHKQQASKMGVIFVTDSGGTSGNEEERQHTISVRRKEAQKVQQHLGFDLLDELNIPDGAAMRFESEIASKIKEHIAQFKPDIVLTPTPIDNHRDHQATAMGVARGLNEAKFGGDVWSYEVWSTIWPNVAVDISSVQADKQKLISMYESQLIGMAYDDAITGLNRYRGLSLQLEFAEAFFVSSRQEYYNCVKELDRL